jgi:hypothetical protein
VFGAQCIEHGLTDHRVVFDQQQTHGFLSSAKPGLSGSLLKPA